MPSIPPDLLEADAVPEDAVKRLKCAPVLARYMQGVSTIWREGHGTVGSMKAQDDVDLCYQSNIVPIGIKVRGDAVESQKAQKRCFKKARKTGRNETKDCGFHYEYKSPYKSKKRSDQTVPQFPSPIRGTVPKIDFDVHETTDGEAVSPPTFQVPLCSSRELMDTAVVPIVFSPPKDPRVHRRKVAPKKPVDDRFDILKNLSDSLKKEAKEILMKEVKTNTTAPTTPLMDGLINDDVLAKADELRRADKVGSLVGLESRKRTCEELDEENRKKSRSSMKSKASNTIDINKLKKALESTIDSIIMDDFELVDEVGDESSVAINSRPGPSTVAKQVFTASKPLTVNLPLRLIPLDCLSNAKGLHLRRGLPRATDEYFHKRRNEFADYLETPIILLEPPRKKGRNQDILKLLGIKMYKAKLKQYLAQPKLSIFEQRSDNGRFNLSTPEIDGIAKGIIPQYGNIDVTKFRMPTKFPYDGLYWPIFQPIDALVIKRSEKDTSRMENADVQNQIVNQATNNYISKRILLCDTSPQAWNRHFQMAFSDKKKRVTVGRFTNRVGYARYLINCDHSQKEIDAARERHRRAQQEEQREIDNQKAQQQREVLKSCNLKEGDAIPVGLLKEYKAAAKSTRLNDHLRATCRDTFSEMDRSNRFQGNRRPNPLPSYWFVIPMQQYVPANDRRTFLCKYTNHYNYNIVKNHPDPCNIVALSKWIGAAMTASHCAQYTKNLLCITLEDQKLGEARNRDIDRTLARGSTVKLSDLKRLCVLRPWEKKYWTLIWDHLCAAFRMLPPVSILVPMLEVPIDNAFKRVAILQNRDVYYNKYTEIKQAYLNKVESIQRMNEQERRRKRDMERRERHSNRNDYRFEYRQEDWQNQHYNQNFDPGENYRRY